MAQSARTHNKKGSPQMQPIHYSLIINLAVLAVTGWLSYVFTQPLLVVIGLMLAQHEMARFKEEDDDDEGDEPVIGFQADIR